MPDYSFLRDFIENRSGIVLDASRSYLFETRLLHLIEEHRLNGLRDLEMLLRGAPEPQLEQDVVEAMTINETSFFRDMTTFEHLQVHLLPRLIERRKMQRALRFWSAACSSGQEAYSLAMLLDHSFPQLADWDVEILGTDIHSDMIRRAHAGRYQQQEISRGLSAQLLQKYFRHNAGEWEISPRLRARCRFERRNLHHSIPGLMKFDGILLRNVLFYFSEAGKQWILRHAHAALAPDGFLLLGSSEHAGMPELWSPAIFDIACHYEPICSGSHR